MNKNRKKILAISGSTRSNSTTETLLNVIAKLSKENLEIHIYSKIAELPHFNPDLDTEEAPQIITEFRELVKASDGVIICTPEYVFSLPGTLKNALEWTVSTTVFSDKPVGLIVASLGGEKAYESLILIMETLGAKIPNDAKLLIQGSRSKVSQEGKITDSDTLQKIHQLINTFINYG